MLLIKDNSKNCCRPFSPNYPPGNVPEPSEALLNKPFDYVLLGVSGAWWFITSLGELVPLCKPYILAVIVFEIDKGTRVLTHSPGAIHKRRQYRRNQITIISLCGYFRLASLV